MELRVPSHFVMELRHDDEPVGRLVRGAIEFDHEVPHRDARFWLGLRALTRTFFAAAFSRPTG